MTPNSPFRCFAIAHAQIAGCLTILCLVTFGAVMAQAQHDCVPYDPTTADNSVSSTWLTPTETDTYQIVIPDDPGGGYVVAIIASDFPVEPKMNIYAPQGPTAPIAQNATNTNGPSPFNLTVAFEVVGGETYNVEVREDVQAPLKNHPIDYQWSWVFVSKPDCYEPNDSASDWAQIAATARQIPLDQLLEAYAISGHLTFSIPSDAHHSFDWYKFTLSQQMQIWFGSMEVPSDQRITFRLFDDAGFPIVEDPPPPVGGTTVVGPSLLSAGTYYLEVHPAPSGANDVSLSEGEPLPDHFDTPYRFVVTTEAIPTCGFMAIFCDGFESGGMTFWSTTP